MTDTITLTDPKTGKTWTSGKRGKRPNWVNDMIAAGTVIPKKVTAKQSKSETPLVPGQLKVWRLTGQAGELGDNDAHTQHGHCMIVAANRIEAVLTANQTFKNPMMPGEIDLLWTEMDPALVADIHASGIDCTKAGIYESSPGGWKPRQKIA